MDAIKRASFASKQVKAGPAPLASFEDLPSDELESPEDVNQSKVYATSALDDESTSRDLQFTTPDSLTISSQSTPRIESDFDSHFTLTPGDPYQGQSVSELRTFSLSSLCKEDSTLCVKQKKGSAVSLGAYDTTESEYVEKKRSWTDIFRSHNPNSAKSNSSLTLTKTSGDKVLKKKSRSESSKKDSSEQKSKEKGKFLSMFMKKSNKNINSPVSPDNYILPSANLNITECLQDVQSDVVAPKFNNGSVPKGKENELPKEIDLSPTVSDVQNDLGKINTERSDKIPDERKLNRKLINISEKSFEKEYNILSGQAEEKQVDKVSKTENIQAIVDEETHESSESELVFEVKDDIVEKKEDDFEAEILLPDVSEIEEDPVIELQPISFEAPKQVILPSRQQRLEITTKPIDRPRSTTPINVAPLEAFIQSVSPTFDAKVEKIKLSLPGEQFVGRLKSPKKSSMKSWTDFCERGLHSPRMHKRIDKEDSSNNPFLDTDGANSPLDVPFSSSSENWAAFETNFESTESNVFDDNFSKTEMFGADSYATGQLHEKLDPYQSFETDFLSCSCECHVYGCGTCIAPSAFESTESQPKGQSVTKLDSRSCSCNCHMTDAFNKADVTEATCSGSIKTCDGATVFGSGTKEF